ncbi:MAG: RNA polymerase factor sigma-54 [Cypionkella sp.]|jgi:RNA polymerase sigma-54 factor|nr:RNA polymerase factor sigma-54 [Cypionkella sp.]
MKSRNRIGVTQTQRLALSVGLQASLRLLRSDAAGLIRYLEEQAAETPALSLRTVLPAAGDWLPRWSGALPNSGPDEAAGLASHGPSLVSHVMQALPGLDLAPADGPIALALIEALEPSGWLGRPLSAIATELRRSEDTVARVLARLQQIDPPGLFARSLAECLSLQAQEAGVMDATMAVMLSRLDLVASGDWGSLSALAAAPEDEIRRRFRLIRSFNPKPGTAFCALASPLREPDLIVRQGQNGWEVSLNHSALPALVVDPEAAGASHARDVLRLVENRNSTLLRVARAILAHQRAALDRGPAALRALTMQSLAASVDLHKSTVSRVVAGASVDTPHGTWWLRALFSPDMGAETAAAALRSRLAQVVAAEPPGAPLSDEALAAALSTDGVTLARRTVAKYRQALRIPPAHQRRQSAL